jgi:hypothetical protein
MQIAPSLDQNDREPTGAQQAIAFEARRTRAVAPWFLLQSLDQFTWLHA